MRQSNIERKLQKMGFELNYGKFGYWNSQPYIKIDSEVDFFIAEHCGANGQQWIETSFKFNDVLEAIDTAKRVVKKNPEIQCTSMAILKEVKNGWYRI